MSRDWFWLIPASTMHTVWQAPHTTLFTVLFLKASTSRGEDSFVISPCPSAPIGPKNTGEASHSSEKCPRWLGVWRFV